MIFGEKMKYRYALAALIVLSFVQLFGNVNAQTNALSIANLDVTPQPVYAGSNVTVSFQLYNSYTAELTNVNLELEGTYPLLNYSPAWTQFLTTVPTGVYGGISLFEYTMHVPKNVKSGTYYLTLVATYQTSSGENTELTSSSSMPISFYIRGFPNLKITANPSTGISPGVQSTVALDVLNVGTDNATNTSITVLNSKNFSVLGGSTFNLGTIAPQATGAASAILLANSTLPAGTPELPVIVRYNTIYGANSYYEEMVPVSESLGSPQIGVGIVSATPESLYPGTNQTLVLSLQNIGSGTAKNVTLSVVGNGNITAGNSASKIFVGTIVAGSTATASLFITANKRDNQNKYNLPVYISYQNANYNLTSNTTVLLPISLQSIAQFNVTGVASDLAPGGTYVPVTLRVKNIGNEAAQSVTFSLETIYPVSQVNPNAYVSAMLPGQTANVTFYVNIDSAANSGQYPITIYEQWSQPTGGNNQQYSSSQTYYVNVGSSGGAGLYEYIIGAVVVVVIAFVVVRRMRKQRTAAKKEKKQ
jgi:hypothetical protein